MDDEISELYPSKVLELSRMFGVILRGNSPETLLSSVNCVEHRQGISNKAFDLKHYSTRSPSCNPGDASYGLELIKAWREAGAQYTPALPHLKGVDNHTLKC